MVAETSEASKDHQSETATGENNTCTYTCSEKCCQWKHHMHVHVQNLQFDQSDFSACKMSCYVIKAMDNAWCASIQFGMHLDSWESTQVARDALGCASNFSYTLPSCSPNYPRASTVRKKMATDTFTYNVLPTKTLKERKKAQRKIVSHSNSTRKMLLV